MNQSKKLLSIILIGTIINNGYILGNPYKETYHIDWSDNSKINHYCRFFYKTNNDHIDEDCITVKNYIIARAVAGRIINYKTSQEKEFTQNEEALSNIEITVKDNFLTEFELDARKEILLKKQDAIKKRLAVIPAVEERMTGDDFCKVINNIMTKASITSDEDVARELGFMIDILKKADEAKVNEFSMLIYSFNH